jgi:acyl-CoA synthetase (AMP-forming)/AMP-acid ligase II
MQAKQCLRQRTDLPFSSGTTGRGKGVEISHLNVIGIAQQLKNTNIFERDIVMGVLPLYRKSIILSSLSSELCINGLDDLGTDIYGLVVLLHQTFYNGGTIVLLKKFDLPIFCASVEKYGATTALIVPPIVLGLAKHPIVDNYDLSSLRFIISGAAPLSAELQKMFETRMRNASKRKYKDNVTQGKERVLFV